MLPLPLLKASPCILLICPQAAVSCQPGGRGPREGWHRHQTSSTRPVRVLNSRGQRRASQSGSPGASLILPSATCYLRALPVSLSVPRALLHMAGATKDLLHCPPRVVPPARNGPRIKERREPEQRSSCTSSRDPAPPPLPTHLCHQGAMVGAVASGGSWDLSVAKEKGNGRGSKGPKHQFGAGIPVLPGPGSCRSFSWSSCGFSGPQIEP